MSEPQPPTFPARPINGGALEGALPKIGKWRAEPKYNGWRALVHIPTGAMWNRFGKRLSIESEFTLALAQLREKFSVVQWADCEALERRHRIARGTLVLLDLIIPGFSYEKRREVLQLRGIQFAAVEQALAPDSLYAPPAILASGNFGFNAEHMWQLCLDANAKFGCEFYEGIVMKRCDAVYPIQLRSHNIETATWMKHRFL
jgi:hypothetical protein